MKKFELFFPKPMKHANDTEAETMFIGKTAYICLREPFDNGSGQHSLLKSKGRIILYNEAASTEECCRQIDSLINNLENLKIEARKRFAE